MRALCLWFALLCRKASTGTVIQKATFVSFYKRPSDSVHWCQEIGPFIPCWEGNFLFSLSLSSPSKVKSSVLFLWSHTEWWRNSCILQMNRDRTPHYKDFSLIVVRYSVYHIQYHVEISYAKSVNQNSGIINPFLAKTPKTGEAKSEVSDHVDDNLSLLQTHLPWAPSIVCTSNTV